MWSSGGIDKFDGQVSQSERLPDEQITERSKEKERERERELKGERRALTIRFEHVQGDVSLASKLGGSADLCVELGHKQRHKESEREMGAKVNACCCS
jgi:hypothetical protein